MNDLQSKTSDCKAGGTTKMNTMKPIQAFLMALALVVSPALADTKASKYAGITSGTFDADGTNVDWGHAIGTVDESFDHVVSVVADYGNYYRFLPNFQKSKVLTHRGNRAMVYMEIGIMKGTVTLWGQLKMAELPAKGEMRIFEAKMIDGNMDQFMARWELTPKADGKKTHVDFRMLVDPGMPLPSSVFTKENIKAAKKAVRALRLRAHETLRS